MPQHSMAPMLFGLRVVMLGRQGVYKALEPGKSTSTTGFEGRAAALGEIAASRARLLHQQRTEGAASQRVQEEPAPA
jgi:hypothetical protein